MSILPFVLSGPIEYYRPRRCAFNPFREIERMAGELQNVAHSGGSELKYNEKGDLTVRCHTAGFKPDELSVDVDGQTLTVIGKHQESHEHESVERQFTRVIRLPKGVDQSQIKCELDDKGELCINIPRREQLENSKQNVPIEMKK